MTSWVTHGLLEASIGVPAVTATALGLLRGHFDWFDADSSLPLYLPPRGGAAGGAPFPDVRGPHADPVEKQQMDNGHLIYIVYQGLALPPPHTPPRPSAPSRRFWSYCDASDASEC